MAQATGAAVQTTVNELNPAVLGTCEKFEEVQVCAYALPNTLYCAAAMCRII